MTLSSPAPAGSVAPLTEAKVAIMSVPCCMGLEKMVERAITESGVDIPMRTVVIGVDGQIASER